MEGDRSSGLARTTALLALRLNSAEAGQEFSAVSGFTYNFTNPTTNYQSGVDWHLDWGASQFLSKQVSVGAVGYF
jgi:hypothetical protein